MRLLGADTACKLAPTRYDEVCEGFGGKGLLLDRKENIASILAEAKRVAATGVPVVVNCMISRYACAFLRLCPPPIPTPAGPRALPLALPSSSSFDSFVIAIPLLLVLY